MIKYCNDILTVIYNYLFIKCEECNKYTENFFYTNRCYKCIRQKYDFEY